MSQRLSYLMLLLFISICGMSQSSHDLLREGDKLFNKEQFNLAEEKYRKAKAKDKSGKASFNLGNTLAVQERQEEAANQFSEAAGISNDPIVKSKALYNLGNTHFRNKKFQESVDAYKSSLSFNQDDQQAKQNLMMAKKMLRVQKQEQQQQQQQDQDQDQEKKDQEQEQKEQEQQDQNQQEESQDQSEEKEEQEQQADEKQKKDLDKEDARKLLEIIDNEEKKVQEKLRKMKGNSKKPKKDW